MESTDNLIYNILDQKVIDYAEIVICLFDHCNLRCVFCPQKHDLKQGASRKEIMSKVPGIVDWINSNTRSKYFKLHIMGGELFQDEWISKGFINFYQEFIDTIKHGVTDNKKVIVPSFVTNLVFNQTQPVIDFLDKNELKLSISYDPKGRFTADQIDLFKENVEIFKPYIQMVSSVMTTQTIHAIIEGDEYYDYLYDNFVCDWDSLLPMVKQTQIMMPKESETLRFYKHLVDHYPKCLNIAPFVEKEESKMSCTRGNSYTVLYDNSVPQGCSASAILRDEDKKVDYYGNKAFVEFKTDDLKSGKVIENFVTKYNCFECPFFRRCPFTCFVKQDFKYLVEDEDECVFRQTFQYAESQEGKYNYA